MSEWPRLVRDLEGLTVRTLRPVSNAHFTLPTGAIGTIVDATGWYRMTFRGEACACCGVQPRITKMSKYDLTPV